MMRFPLEGLCIMCMCEINRPTDHLLHLSDLVATRQQHGGTRRGKRMGSFRIGHQSIGSSYLKATERTRHTVTPLPTRNR